MGIRTLERALKGWIQVKWNPKGVIEMQFGSKGFFTVVFTLLEEKDHIFEGGPYFFNFVGFYMTFWKENFMPKQEDFTRVPV